MDTGSLIFFGLIGLYLIGGPFVLLIIYVLLDRYSRKTPIFLIKPQKSEMKNSPALWSFYDVKRIMEHKEKLQKGYNSIYHLPKRQ